MKQALILFGLLISIYDLPHDPKNVIVEACSQADTDCVRVKVPRADLEKETTLDLLENILTLRQDN